MTTFTRPGVVTLLLIILSTCLLLFLFQKIVWLVLPALLALILYYCLRPIVEKFVACGLSPKAAAKCAWILLQSLAIAAILASGLLVAAKAGTWQSGFDHYLAGGQNLLKGTIEAVENLIPIFRRMGVGAAVDQYMQQFSSKFAEKHLLPVTLLLLKGLPSLLLVPYFAYFILSDSARLKQFVINSVPNAFFEKALLLISRLDASLQNYFQGLLLLTLLDAVCLSLGLAALGVGNCILLGLGAAVLAWIPYVGSAIGCVVVVFVAATDYPEKSWIAYACLFLFLAIRVLDDVLFVPLTIGRKLHLHPTLSVLMLFLGATVAGPTGLVLALPMFWVVAVIGETVSEILTDNRLIARYRAARRLVTADK